MDKVPNNKIVEMDEFNGPNSHPAKHGVGSIQQKKKETKFAELERKANQIKTNRMPNRKDRQFESIEKELIERDVKL